jgi:hypothetical protein
MSDQTRDAGAHMTDFDAGCLHPGEHSKPNPCIECGRFSAHSWATRPTYGPDGFDQSWGGTCKVHGEWNDSVA